MIDVGRVVLTHPAVETAGYKMVDVRRSFIKMTVVDIE